MTYEKWIDIAKGIGILLVIIGHSPCNSFIVTMIYTFHIPLFFFIAGYLFHYHKYKKNPIQYFRNKFQRLVVPYFFTNFSILGFYFLTFHFNSYTPFDSFNPLDSLVGVFYGNGASLTPSTIFTNNINIPSWFLVSLFCGSLILYIIAFFHEKYGLLFSCFLTLLFVLVGFKISKHMFLPWGFDVACVSMVFMFPAYLISYYKFDLSHCDFKNIFSHCLLFIFLILVAISVNGRVDMNGRSYSNLWVFGLGAFSGTLLIIRLANKIAKKENIFLRLFTYLGKNSLIILLFHTFSAGFLLNLMGLFLNIKPTVANSSFLCVLNMLISSILTIMIIKKVPILKEIYL